MTHSQTPTFVIDWPLNEWVSYDSLLRCRPVAKVGVWYCRWQKWVSGIVDEKLLHDMAASKRTM